MVIQNENVIDVYTVKPKESVYVKMQNREDNSEYQNWTQNLLSNNLSKALEGKRDSRRIKDEELKEMTRKRMKLIQKKQKLYERKDTAVDTQRDENFTTLLNQSPTL